MLAIVVRGPNGTVTWGLQPTGVSTHDWVCSRDQFVVHGPTTRSQLEPTLLAIGQHSQQLVGAISQVVQLDV